MKRKEIAAKMSETRRTPSRALDESYKLLFDAAPDAILVVDSAGIIRLNNVEAERLLEAATGELRGLPVEKLVPLSARKHHAKLRESYMSEPRKRPMGIGLSLSAVKRSGREFPVEISLSPTRNESSASDDVIVILRDVSDRLQARRTERELVRANALARVSEAALRERELVEALREVADIASHPLAADVFGVFMLNAEREHLDCVAAAGALRSRIDAQMIPRSEQMLSGQALQSATPVLIGDTLTAADSLCDLLRDLRVRSLMIAPLNDRERGNGLLIAGALEPNRFTTEDIAFLEAIANIVANALQRNNIEEKLLLSQRLESLGQLTGGVAHDFNNLLTVMSGNLQILGDSKLEDAYAERALAAAHRATQRGTELTGKLLAFSRRQTLRPESIDIANLLDGFRDLLARTIGANVEIVVRTEARLPSIVADSGQLETALLNLAVNARDAMPNGGKIMIDASTFDASDTSTMTNPELPAGRYVRISVTDTGIGMSRDTLARAFEPFFTTKGAGKGSGLGLSMVYGFAKQSAGHVSAYSEPNFGTTINLYLPASAKKARTRTFKAEQPAVAQGGNEMVLIVEDDDGVRAIAEQFLQALGYRVLAVADRATAIAKLKANPEIDLLFTDVVLKGGETGPKVAEALHKLKPGLPVLYASGYARDALPLQIAIDGDLSFLRKPYTREALARAVRDVLERKRDISSKFAKRVSRPK
jgi:PAS domain S-box-containing protein